jgi:FkbM family methyltransferase
MINFLKKIAENIVPPSKQLFLRLLTYKILGKVDNEIIYADKILKKKRRFLDIGSNVGIYSYYFSRKFKNLESFEPIKEITYRLSALKLKNIKLYHMALSNKNNNLKFYIPIKNGKLIPPLASLEKRAKPYEKRIIKVKKLDDFNFKNVDLIKIDVEGHEQKVIIGATKTIKKNLPIIICEIEQRHTLIPIKKIFNLIENFGYEGFFFKNYKLHNLKKFSFNLDQKPYLKDVENKNYINNFIFIPISKKKLL